MIQMVLFPSGYSRINKVDEDLQREYDAVTNTGLYEICLFGYEKWFRQGQLVLLHKPEKPTAAVYRGWMMKPEQYEQFYQKLYDNNIRLITPPEEYRKFHVFPNIYPLLSEDTAGMMIFPEGSRIDLDAVRKRFERFMVKDYAELADGSWKIIEAGDGQVSGLLEGQDYEAFFRALYQCFKEDTFTGQHQTPSQCPQDRLSTIGQ
ncbi:MAG: ATP-grasp domain-containing protein [Acetatifactor sp.]|nr:ATP-grasp domain-containing protein [Acetatifactor sp.]MDE7043499.1 ATP-grasp domain-containing protein [Acetatifactor sp.]